MAFQISFMDIAKFLDRSFMLSAKPGISKPASGVYSSIISLKKAMILIKLKKRAIYLPHLFL